MVTVDPLGQPARVDAVAGEAVLADAAIGAVSQWRFAASDRSRTFLLGVNVVPRDTSLSTTMSAPVRIGGTVRPPQRIANVSPVYPDAARDAGVQGVVILEARIGPDGIIDSAHVLRSIPALDVAALTSVVQWRYTPTVVDGVAVSVIMTVTVNFTLQ
jgi:TonB family protein